MNESLICAIQHAISGNETQVYLLREATTAFKIAQISRINPNQSLQASYRLAMMPDQIRIYCLIA